MTFEQTCLFPADALDTEAAEATETLTVSFVVVFSDHDEEAEKVLPSYLQALQDVAYQHELIVINNGQGDALNDKIFPILRAAKSSAEVLQIHVSASESQAFSHGFKECSGDVIVVLPAYLQVDAEDILWFAEDRANPWQAGIIKRSLTTLLEIRGIERALKLRR